MPDPNTTEAAPTPCGPSPSGFLPRLAVLAVWQCAYGNWGANQDPCVVWSAANENRREDPAGDRAVSSAVGSRRAPACGGGYAPCRLATTVGHGSSRRLGEACGGITFCRAHNREVRTVVGPVAFVKGSETKLRRGLVGQGSVPTLCLCCLAKLIQTISIQELDPEGLKRGKPVMAGEFFEAVACEGPRWLTHRGWPSGSRWHLTMGPKASHLKGPVLCHIDASFGRTAESFLGLDSGGSSPNLAKLTSLPVRPLDEGCRTQPGLGRTVAVGLSGAEVTTQGLTHCFCLGKSMTHRFPATRGVLGHRGSPGFGTLGKTVAGEI
jgi:hypothetical protein